MVESVQFLKSQFFKNVTGQGGAQAHAIKVCPKDHILVQRDNGKHARIWGFMTPQIYLNTVQKNHNLFEIISSFPHKVYFDIDEKESDDFPAFIQSSKEKILSYFPNAEISISGSNQGKASLHVTLQNYMIYNDYHRNQVKQVAKECGFDTAVYTKNRLMKCINQSKADGRVQALIEGDDLKQHCITYFFSESLPFTLPETIQERVDIASTESDTFNVGSLPSVKLTTDKDLWDLTCVDILALLPISKDYKHNYTHMIARFCYGNEIPFETFYEWRSKKGEALEKWKYTWSRLHLFPPVTIDRMKALLQHLYPKFKKDKYYARFASSFELDNVEKIETISQTNFEGRCLIFNTGMGSGKTAQTIDYLTEDKEFLWITCNVALTNNTEQRFIDKHRGNPYNPDETSSFVTNYLKIDPKDKKQGILNLQKKLLCTLHSLHYIEKDFPLLVIDEMETVLNIFKTDFLEQGNKKLKKKIWETFTRLLKNSKQIILLDAFTTTKTTDLLKSLEIPYTIKERLYEPTTRTIKFMENEGTMITDIQEKIRQNSKVLIFYPYKNRMPELKKMFDEVLDKDITKYYNADEDDLKKKELGDVNENWDAQVIMFNNVITCGVNYEKLDFDYMYIFFASFNTPRDMIQVSYRARFLSSGIINVTFLPNLKPTTYPKDCDRINCPMYTQLYNNIMNEAFSPNKNAFKRFCIQAHYKTTMDKHRIEKELEDSIEKRLRENKFFYYYGDVEEIDQCLAESFRDKCFEQCATMYEKVQLHKYYYNLQFINKEDDLVGQAWNDKLFFFLKQLGWVMFTSDNLFMKIAKFNNFKYNGEFHFFPTDVTKVKLNPELLDQIFKEFTFKNLTRESSSKKIVKEIYNVFFKTQVIKSEYNKLTKNTTYSIHHNIVDYYPLYMTNFFLDEFGTWIPLPNTDVELDPEPEWI
jgi:hypothetical protein